MDIDNLLPRWGSSGESPETGKEYEAREQVDHRHFNYLWNATERTLQSVIDALGNHAENHQTNGDDTLDAGNLGGHSGSAGQVLKTNDFNANWEYDDSNVDFLKSGWINSDSSTTSSLYNLSLTEGPYTSYKLVLYGGGWGENTNMKLRINNSTEDYTNIIREGAETREEVLDHILVTGPSAVHAHAEVTINSISVSKAVSADVTTRASVPVLERASPTSADNTLAENVTLIVDDQTREEYVRWLLFGIKSRRAWGYGDSQFDSAGSSEQDYAVPPDSEKLYSPNVESASRGEDRDR